MSADETVGGVLARSLHRGGDRVALRARGEVRTHSALLQNASRFANALSGNGLQPGDHVALMVADGIDSVEAYLGCLIGGFAAVHVNDRLAPPEVQRILADADARAFVYSGQVAAKVAELEEESLGMAVALGEGARAGHADWSGLLARAATATPQVARRADDLAIVGFTSGTTGQPKGVVHTQQSVLRILRHMPTHFDLRPRSRCAFTGTLSFVAGLWGVLLPHLYLGGEVSFMAGLDPDEWFARMLAEGSTFTYVPTPLATQFVDQVRRNPAVLDQLRTAVHSGSAMPRDHVRGVVDAIGSRFVENYGMTETGAPVTTTEPGDWSDGCEAADVYASTGRPVHIADVLILDADGRAVPTGETGEITVRTETQFAGYYKRPELTSETIVDGRIRTGDIGRVDEAGYLYVTDRAKDMIITGGMNVYPAEVEAALADVPGLAEVAVFGVPHERWGETVVAVAVSRDPQLDESAFIDAARARLASYKKPTQVHFVDALPRTASLKVDKPALRRTWATEGA
ncbi:class I adenylate-forming enzyme family protein [Angustibacter sp. McL0619]|uniref:class I adenylate-forming enzyme family protein n=1 Tax=Angustibacter sp. McL0619 TaxID=3415676 RepID=UPI003CF9968D